MDSEIVDSGKKFLQQVIMDAPYGTVVINDAGKIMLSNTLAKEFFLIDKDDILGTPISNYLSAAPELIELIDQLRREARDQFDVMELAFNGRVLTVRGRRTEDWSIITVQDITRWKEMEMEGVRAMLEGQEQERRRIAKEIHDGVGAQLSSTLMNLEALKLDVEDKVPESVDRLEMLAEVVSDISDELRSISHALMPRVLVDFGLVAALQGIAERINRSGRMSAEVMDTTSGEDLDRDLEFNLFRIAQELINNALKHSNGTKVIVQLVKSDSRVALTVEDNGEGIDMEKLRTAEGIGFSNIEIRAKIIGGMFNLDSAPDRGLIATVEVPLE